MKDKIAKGFICTYCDTLNKEGDKCQKCFKYKRSSYWKQSYKNRQNKANSLYIHKESAIME